ncbi:MAG: hypothetical protein M1840_003854 [Geoglossum simile]|nr:MAG: hypothetical protein M1840_003854 [Geoglossum simile]
MEPLPAPISPTSDMDSELEEVEFGEAANPREGKGSRIGKFGRRSPGSPTFESPEPKTLVSVPYTSTSKPLISVPYSSTVSLDSNKPVTENNEETRGRPRWQRGGQRNTGGIQRTGSGSKKKTEPRGGIHIPMPEYKKKSTFTVPSLPSLAQRKKWAVGDRMSGLFSGRMFNRMEVKEIIDTSVKNYDSMDPSRRYSRAKDVGHAVNPGLDMDPDSASASSVVNKPLPPPPTSVSQRPSTAPSTSTAPTASTQLRGYFAVEYEGPTAEPEPKMLKGGFDGMRRSFLMDPQSQTEDGNDQSPVIGVADDLAMAVIEEESALPLTSRRLYQSPPLPSIPELLPQMEKGNSRKTSPRMIAAMVATAVPPVPTRLLPPSGTGVKKPHLTSLSTTDLATTSAVPPPIPPKSASRASYIVAPTPVTSTPTAAAVPSSPRTPYNDPLQTTSATTAIAAVIRPQPQADTPNPDWTTLNTAITRSGDYLGGGNSDIVPDDSLVDWFSTYNFDGGGTLARAPSTTYRSLPNTITTTPSLPSQMHTPPRHPIVVEEPVPPLESDTDIDPDAATSLTSTSNRTSSLLQLPTTAGTDTDGVSVNDEERVKMGCNFNDGSLGDFLSWEVNLLRVVGDGAVEE